MPRLTSASLLLLALLLAAPCIGQTAPGISAGPFESLIAELGSDSYATREEATQRLLEVGAPALPALKKGATALDREIRQRCRRLLSVLALSDLQDRIDAFLADTHAANDYGLPFWSEFHPEYGSSEVSRKLFVEMQRHESALLQAIVDQPGNTADLVEVRSQQLQNFTNQEGRSAPLGSILTLLSVAGIRHDKVADETHPKLFHFCHQAEFQAAIEGGPRREVLRRMLGKLVREADNIWSLYYVLDLAMKYDLQEGLPQALGVVANRNSQPHIRQLAILAVGKLGDKSHLPLLESQFDDSSRTGSHSINERVYHQQIRDLALAVSSHLRGYDLDEIGLERSTAHPYMLFQPSTLGFENEVDRQAAFERYARRRGPQAVADP
jgi:hypothetical protein